MKYLRFSDTVSFQQEVGGMKGLDILIAFIYNNIFITGHDLVPSPLIPF